MKNRKSFTFDVNVQIKRFLKYRRPYVKDSHYSKLCFIWLVLLFPNIQHNYGAMSFGYWSRIFFFLSPFYFIIVRVSSCFAWFVLETPYSLDRLLDKPFYDEYLPFLELSRSSISHLRERRERSSVLYVTSFPLIISHRTPVVHIFERESMNNIYCRTSFHYGMLKCPCTELFTGYALLLIIRVRHVWTCTSFFVVKCQLQINIIFTEWLLRVPTMSSFPKILHHVSDDEIPLASSTPGLDSADLRSDAGRVLGMEIRPGHGTGHSQQDAGVRHSVSLDLTRHQFLFHVLHFPFSHTWAAQKMEDALKQLHCQRLKIIPCALRHGGASEDRAVHVRSLEEVQKRGA